MPELCASKNLIIVIVIVIIIVVVVRFCFPLVNICEFHETLALNKLLASPHDGTPLFPKTQTHNWCIYRNILHFAVLKSHYHHPHHHQVTCLTASAVTDLHLSLFETHASVIVAFFIIGQALRLSSYFPFVYLYFPSSTLPVVTRCSIGFRLIIWPKNMDWFFFGYPS